MLRNVGLRKSVEQPVLDLNFAASQIGSNGAPDSRIDFSRGTNAWFVDSDGLVKKSPHNLLLQSEDFSTTWGAIGDVTVATNEIVSPDGTTTADKISSANFGAGGNHIRQGSGTIDAGTYTASVFVKAGSLDTFKFRIVTFAPSTVDGNSVFDLSTGEWTSINANHTVSTEAYPNDWFRLSITFSNPASGAVQPRFAANSGSGFIYVWGAQLSQHTTLPVDNPYIKTEGSAVYAARLDHDPAWFMSAAQEQNLLRYSEMLDDSAWSKLNVTVTADATTDPLGGTTAERVENGTNTGTHVVYATTNNELQVTSGTTYTFSAYVKADELYKIRLTLATTNFPNQTADFDLSAESVTTTGSVSASITDSGNGWYRCAITVTANGTGQNNANLWLLNAAGQLSYTGANNGLFIWGVQFEVGNTASTYHRTEGAPYYGEGATPKGLLIEEARTNLLDDSNDLTIDDGLSGGITNEQNAALGLDGTVTAAKIKANSTTPTNPRVFFPSSGLTLSAADYTYSIFLKKAELNWVKVRLGVSGSFPGVFFDLDNGTVGTASTGFTGRIVEYGNGWYRCSITAAASIMSASTFYAGVHLASADNTVLTSATVGDGVFIWGHSLELGSFPTSYIETTGSTTTRNADVAVMGPTTGGTELVTNGTFDTDTTGWTEGQTSGVTATVSSGVVTASASTASGAGIFYQSAANTPTVIGRRYRATAELSVVSGSGTSLVIYSSFFAGQLGSSSITSGSNQTVTVDFTATTTATHVAIFRVSPFAADDVYKVDNVSVRELYPFEQYNSAEGTLYSLSSCTGTDTHAVLSMHADSFDNYLSHTYRFGNSLRNFSKGGGSTELQTAEAVTLSNRNEIATTYDGTSMDMSANGSDETTGTLGADIVGIHEIAFGLRYTANQYSGHIERVQYFPRALPKVTLQSLTSD